MPAFILGNAERIRNTLIHEQQKEIAKMYENLYLKNKKALEQIKNSKAFEDRLERIRLSQLVKQLEKAYKSFAPELERQIRKKSEESAQLVIDDMNSYMSKTGLSTKGAYARVAQNVVESIATGQVYGGNWSLSNAIWRNINKHQSDINRIIAEGAAQNLSSYEIAKALEKYINPKAKKPWDWSKVYPGTNRVIDYNAQRLARTMISHAYQQSLERVCKKNPFVESYTWRAAQNERTCSLCMERNGKVYNKGKLPLDHPNGRCTFLVNMPSMDDIAERLGNWANGKLDLNIDTWVIDMHG